MSRNGRIPINIPENTQVRIDNGIIFAKGKLGELSFAFKNDAKVELSDNSVVVQKGGDSRYFAQMWGTVRSRIHKGREILDKTFSKYNMSNLETNLI